MGGPLVFDTVQTEDAVIGHDNVEMELSPGARLTQCHGCVSYDCQQIEEELRNLSVPLRCTASVYSYAHASIRPESLDIFCSFTNEPSDLCGLSLITKMKHNQASY